MSSLSIVISNIYSPQLMMSETFYRSRLDNKYGKSSISCIEGKSDVAVHCWLSFS